jgi:dTDP-4-dehydrorhamnose 3,5-epimerase
VQFEDLVPEGLKLVTPRVFPDDRGFFFESYHRPRYSEGGIEVEFVQDNHSHSTYGTIRGMHFQSGVGQAKLLRVANGRIFDVAVDIRPGSATFGQWKGVYLDSETHQQLYVPVGFAHGFCVVSEEATVMYKVSSVYDGATETGFKWNDPDVGIEWPVDEPCISARDQTAQSFADLRAELGA